LYYDTLKKRKLLIEKHDVVVSLDNSCRKMKEFIDTTKKDKPASRFSMEGANPDSIVEGK